jgi:hypothetical protein
MFARRHMGALSIPATDSYGLPLTPLQAPNGITLVVGSIPFGAAPGTSYPVVGCYRSGGSKQGANGYRIIRAPTSGNTSNLDMASAAFKKYLAKGQIIEYIDGAPTANSNASTVPVSTAVGIAMTGVTIGPGWFFADPVGGVGELGQPKQPLDPRLIAAFQWGMQQLQSSTPVTPTAVGPTMSQNVTTPQTAPVPTATSSKLPLYLGIAAVVAGGAFLMMPSGKK